MKIQETINEMVELKKQNKEVIELDGRLYIRLTGDNFQTCFLKYIGESKKTVKR